LIISGEGDYVKFREIKQVLQCKNVRLATKDENTTLKVDPQALFKLNEVVALLE
jgi:hypothetical protein